MTPFKRSVNEIVSGLWASLPALIPLLILFDSFPKLKTPWQLYFILFPIAFVMTWVLLLLEPIIIVVWLLYALVSLPFVTIKWVKSLKTG